MSDPKSPNNTFDDTEAGSAIRRALALPDIIGGHYRVVGRLGAGAMGVVLRAEDLFLERPVAIKVVEPDPQVVERFVKEAQALAQVRHENVVQVYAFGPLQDSYYLAMELVVGQPLDNVIDAYTLAGEMMPLPRALSILRAIGRGLEAVHARKLVHRDVKPGNVILEKESDRPVLIDFGLARRRSKSSPKMSITGGTPSYMAPEQARDPDGRRVTARTDLYAFACTAFEVFTGRPVFEGNDIYTVLLAHMTEEPRKISTLRPELAAIDNVIARAMAKDPEDRYATIGEMIGELEGNLGMAPTIPPASLSESGGHSPSAIRSRGGAPYSLPAPTAKPPSNGPPTAPSPSRAPAPHEVPRASPLPPTATVIPCVLVLAVDQGLRRSLVRNATQSLAKLGVNLPFETVGSAQESSTFISSAFCDLFIVDEDSAAGRLPELITLMRSRRPSAEIVVISRDFPATQRACAATPIRHLVPKPVNIHVLAAVLSRLDITKNR